MYLYLARISESKMYALISAGKGSKLSDMSKDSGIPERTIRRIIAKLIEKGYVQRKGGDKSGKWIPTSDKK
jgi:DNA-binding IclR family transcriptional regulator